MIENDQSRTESMKKVNRRLFLSIYKGQWSIKFNAKDELLFDFIMHMFIYSLR
jgi:hypothetical protein